MPGEAPFRSQPARVLVAGGGIAAVELLVALRKLAAERVEVELLTAGNHLVYRPLLVAEPFGVGSVHRFPLAEILADQGATRRSGRLAAVDAQAHEAITDSDERLPYDALAVATGARPIDALLGALTFSGQHAVGPLRELVERAAHGELGSIVFALPPPATSWPLPLYELALMTATRAPGARIIVATPERMPLELFGEAASAAVKARLEQAGIELRLNVAPVEFADGALLLAHGDEPIGADAAVALPALEVVPIEGLPANPAGYVPVDDHCRVEGLEDVYAAGDVTAFPIKQGGVSARQAQAVAQCLAARAGAPVTPEPFRPLIRGMLLTGGGPGYLQSGAGESLLADSPLWWPPTKIADSYLVPYLVARFQLSIPTLPGPEEADLISSVPAETDVPARPARPTG
ncbi:MAG TPA: FAD-dependent oxidoreductase [Thermoleophilaceae bacterium]|jgi:sulfide:quinone oxidoreductase